MAEESDEKTEEATQTRREDFRKRGQVAQTRELASVLALLSSALVLWFLGRFFLQQITEMMTMSVGAFFVDAARDEDYRPAAAFIVKRGLLIVAPFMAILGVSSIASTVLQVGILNNEEALDFNLEKLNPIEGFKRMFSVRALVEGLKSIVKLIFVISIVAMVVKDQAIKVPLMVSFSLNQIMSMMGEVTVRLLAGLGIFMAVLAAADYFFQRFQLEKQMRMTKQEVKEEHKSREGDPMIKARIRRIQREMANKRMMADIPKADVIITNPTHIACALRYNPETMASPTLVAKGADKMAERIKEVAREHGIPIMENKPLARTIFKSLKIGHAIPRELFTAVAQVLSYVYKLKRKVAR
jgi:flagellar biosynthetic protein FlhB